MFFVSFVPFVMNPEHVGETRRDKANKMSWRFHNPVDIRFGEHSVDALDDVVRERRVLLLTTPGTTRRGLTARVRQALYGRDVVVDDTAEPNPDIAALDERIARLAGEPIDAVVAVGGGSALDAGKAVAVGVVSARDTGSTLRDHFSGRADAAMNLERGLPVYALPTTAGTGSEVTPFATIWDMQRKAKHSLVGPLWPRAAILDPTLTHDLPPEPTLAGGLDALVQGLESIWNRHATPTATAFATQAVRLALDALPAVLRNPRDAAARDAMMQASLLAGLAISQTRTALAHAMSYPLTAHLGMPHGLACGFWLLPVLRFNAEHDDGRLNDLATSLGLAGLPQLDERVVELVAATGACSSFRRYVRTQAELFALQDEMLSPQRAGNNMRPARAQDIEMLVTAAWHGVR